mgnify:CR=1 FL=1
MEEKNLYSNDSKIKICGVTKIEEAKKNLGQISLVKLRKLLNSEQEKIYLEAMMQILSKKDDDILTKEKVTLVRDILRLRNATYIDKFSEAENQTCFLDVIEACLNINDTKIKESVVETVLVSYSRNFIKKLLGVNKKGIFPDKETAFLTTLKNMLDKKSANEHEYKITVKRLLNTRCKCLTLKLAKDSSYFCNVALNILDCECSLRSVCDSYIKPLNDIKDNHDLKIQQQVQLFQPQEETKMAKIKKKLRSASILDLSKFLIYKESDIYFMAINEILSETKLSDQNIRVPTEGSVLFVKRILRCGKIFLVKKLCEMEKNCTYYKGKDEYDYTESDKSDKSESRFIYVINYALNDELNKFIELKTNPEKQKYFELFRIWDSDRSKFMIELILNLRYTYLFNILSNLDEHKKHTGERSIFIDVLKKILHNLQQKNIEEYRLMVKNILESVSPSFFNTLMDNMGEYFNNTVMHFTNTVQIHSEPHKIEIQQTTEKTDCTKEQIQVKLDKTDQQIKCKKPICNNSCNQSQSYQIQQKQRPCQVVQPIYYDQPINYYNQYQVNQIQLQRPCQVVQPIYYDQPVVNYFAPEQTYYMQQQLQQLQQHRYIQQVGYEQIVDNRCNTKTKLRSEIDENELRNLFLAEKELDDPRKRLTNGYNTPSAKRYF